MPKRHKHLFEQIVSLGNLFAAAHKAMRGKRGKASVSSRFGKRFAGNESRAIAFCEQEWE